MKKQKEYKPYPQIRELTNLEIERIKAIRILEEIAGKMDNEKMFDKNWYELEDIITEIIKTN